LGEHRTVEHTERNLHIIIVGIHLWAAACGQQEAAIMLLDKEKLKDKLLEVIEVFPWYKELIGGERTNYSLEKLPLMT